MKSQAEAEQIRIQILKKMSFQEKWQEVLKLRDFAYQLKRAALKETHPNKTDQELDAAVKKVFLYASS